MPNERKFTQDSAELYRSKLRPLRMEIWIDKRLMIIMRQTLYPGFFWTFRKKLKAKKKLKQIIQKLNNLPTNNWRFAQKSPEVDLFCTKICPNKLETWKIQGILEKKIPFFWINSMNFQKNSRDFRKNSRFCQLDLVFIAGKTPKNKASYITSL